MSCDLFSKKKINVFFLGKFFKKWPYVLCISGNQCIYGTFSNLIGKPKINCLNNSFFSNQRLTSDTESDIIQSLDYGNSKRFAFVFNKKLAQNQIPLK